MISPSITTLWTKSVSTILYENIYNEFYSRDISRKIRSTYLNKARKGEFTGAYAPLGYKKDPKNHNHLIVDDETAWIIQKMFKLAREGWGTQRIKTEFERAKIPNPSWWNRERGFRIYYKRFEGGNSDDGNHVWNVTTIKKMLTQPAYIGSIASQKSICAFKLGWMGYRPQEEWITVENTHEPLVDIETWDIVQKKIKERKRPGASGEWSIFAGLLKCSTCGKTMTARYNSKREKHYSCLTYNRYGKDHCTQHRTRDTLIYDTVLKEIQTLAKLAFKDKDKAIIKILSQTKSKSKTDNANMEKQFKAATKRKKELEQMINKIYQDWVAGVLTEENFKRILQQCQEEQKKQDAIISEYTTVIEEKEQTLSATQNAISILDKYTDIKELSAIILNELIEKIVIGEVEKVDGKPVQTMEIYFRFPYIARMKIR